MFFHPFCKSMSFDSRNLEHSHGEELLIVVDLFLLLPYFPVVDSSFSLLLNCSPSVFILLELIINFIVSLRILYEKSLEYWFCGHELFYVLFITKNFPQILKYSFSEYFRMGCKLFCFRAWNTLLQVLLTLKFFLRHLL